MFNKISTFRTSRLSVVYDFGIFNCHSGTRGVCAISCSV